ncbi:MAG TPA: DUF6789 family protein [Myxococcales bacterium]|nr:DUF6789 family protein [Myxococcales bacterium]
MAEVKISLERQEMARVSWGGVLAGLAAGLFLAVVLVLTFALKGQDFWPAFKGAAAPFYRGRATLPGFDPGPVLLGTIAHFAISAAWGWLFAVICYGLPRSATLVAGVLWGVVVWLGMYYVVLPIVGLREMARSAPVGMAIFQHILFGVVLAAAFLPYQRRVPSRWPVPGRASS